MVHIYTTEKTIHQFVIGYMINPSLEFNKIFNTQVEKCLGYYVSIGTIKTIKKILMKKNISIMELIIIHENNGEIPFFKSVKLCCLYYHRELCLY